MTQKIKLLYANINSYINKKHLINHYIQNNNIDCTMFVETKTKQNHSTAFQDWSIIKKKGNIVNKNIWGGSLIQARRNLNIGKENPPRINNPLN